jgi:hypothetical protein
MEADGMAADDTQAQPGSTGSGGTLPDFAMALRGYDRLQVDDYLERQQRWAAEVVNRLQDAEHRAEAGEAAAWAVRVLTDELRCNPNSIEDSRPPGATARRNGP